MAADKWLDGYGGQTTEELLALEGEYRADSLVLAFERAIHEKAESFRVSREERYVLAVEALEREVNNGGYKQFFLNSSHEFVDVIEEALLAIGCVQTAVITRKAIAALGITGELTGDKAEQVVLADDEPVHDALEACDARYSDNDEAIADRLFEWIKANRKAVQVGKA